MHTSTPEKSSLIRTNINLDPTLLEADEDMSRMATK
jgi:hypothetical protein